jgi:hypothetical protein
LLHDRVLAFADDSERANAKQLSDRLRAIVVPSDSVHAERAAGEAAELVAAIGRTLVSAYWREESTLRIDRMLDRLAEVGDQPSFALRRKSVADELNGLRNRILTIALDSDEFNTKLATAVEAIDALAASSAALGSALRFIDSAAEQNWAVPAQVAEWRDTLLTAAAHDHHALLGAIDGVLAKASSRYDQVAADPIRHVREYETAVTRDRMDLFARATSLEDTIFEPRNLASCPDLVLPASKQLSDAREALFCGDIDRARSLIKIVSDLAADLHQIVEQRRRDAAIDQEEWQSRLDALVADARSRETELPKLVPEILSCVERLRSRPPRDARGEADRLAKTLEKATRQAARAAAVEFVVRLLREKAAVPEDDLDQIHDLAASPGRTILIAGSVAGKSLELEVMVDEDGLVTLLKGDDDDGTTCDTLDMIVSELAHHFGKSAVDYFNPDGSVRPVPASVDEPVQQEERASQSRAMGARR